MQATPFSFDTEFAPDGTIVREGGRPRTLFTANEVEAARSEAYAAGKQDALAQAEKRAAEALNSLARQVERLLSAYDAEARTLRTEAAALALAAARKVAGEALDRFGAERAEAAVAEAMDALRHGPRLIVRLPEAMAGLLAPRLEAAAARAGFAGALLVRGEPGLAAGDVALDWTDGLIAHDRAEAFARIDAIITRALSAPAHEATP